MDVRDGKKMMGERLEHYMIQAGLSVPGLEAAVKNKPRRSYIYKIIEGTANFSINVYEKLLKACNNVTLAECLRSLRDDSKIPEDCADLYDMLDVIVESRDYGDGFKRQVEGVRVNLEAISLNVRQMKTRASPSPRKGAGEGTQGGTKARTSKRTQAG